MGVHPLKPRLLPQIGQQLPIFGVQSTYRLLAKKFQKVSKVVRIGDGEEFIGEIQVKGFRPKCIPVGAKQIAPDNIQLLKLVIGSGINQTYQARLQFLECFFGGVAFQRLVPFPFLVSLAPKDSPLMGTASRNATQDFGLELNLGTMLSCSRAFMFSCSCVFMFS
jgi:hypothetical protein